MSASRAACIGLSWLSCVIVALGLYSLPSGGPRPRQTLPKKLPNLSEQPPSWGRAHRPHQPYPPSRPRTFEDEDTLASR